MEANENHALTKAESCYHCKPLVQQRNELAAQVGRLRGLLYAVIDQDAHKFYFMGTDWGREAVSELSEPQKAAIAAQTRTGGR